MNAGWQLNKLMCQVGHRIWLRGYCAGHEGDHSLRLGDDRLLCTPAAASVGFLEPQQVCLVDMEGKPVEPNPTGCQPTGELGLHLAIYRHRPNVKAIIHSHPPHATAFAVANVPIPEGIHPQAELCLGKVPIARYATPSSAALADSVTQLVGPQTNTVILGNHGTVSFSDQGLLDAYAKLEIVDAYCRILLLAVPLGRVKTLSDHQLMDLLTAKQQMGQPDDRLACADDGCIGQDNEPYLAALDARPVTATCGCNGGPVQTTCTEPGQPQSAAPSHARFESLVRTITDQIVGNAGTSRPQESR